MNLFKKWSSREYSLRTRLLALIPAGLLFVGLIPLALILWIPRLDNTFHFPPLFFGVANYIIGGLLIVFGLAFAWPSIYLQLFYAAGTPIPAMPTQKLLVTGVFHLCRNPMTFGTFSAYLGIAILSGSISSTIVVLAFVLLLILYLKNVEEKELEMRFGEEYLAYKKATPFFFPGLFRKR